MNLIRRIIVFLLGILLLLDSLKNTFRVLEFIVALIMIGLIPIDTIIDLIMRPAQNEIDIERLHKVMSDIPHTPDEEEANDKDHPDTTEEENEPDTPTDT